MDVGTSPMDVSASTSGSQCDGRLCGLSPFGSGQVFGSQDILAASRYIVPLSFAESVFRARTGIRLDAFKVPRK